MGDRSRRRTARSLLWEPLVRRRRRLAATALVGLCAGAAVPLLHPPDAVATTSLVLDHRIGDDPATAMATDVSLATSRQLATRAVDRLGVRETPDELLKRYTATAKTDRVLELSAHAESGAEAERIVRTVGRLLLSFRVEQSRERLAPLRGMLADARSDVAGLRRTPSTAPTHLAAAEDRVKELRDEVEKEEAAARPVSQSVFLYAPTVRTPSRFVAAGVGGAIGLAAGLAGAAGLLVLGAMLTDRARSEREIARALGTPVAEEPDGIPPGEAHDLDSAVDLLLHELTRDETMRPTLAIVPVDCVPTAATAVAALAAGVARAGGHVLVTDLTRNGVLARRFGVLGPGTPTVSVDDTTDAEITVHRPDDAEPRGRLHHADGADGDDDLLVAWALSDAVVTLAELSPSAAAEHLHTWADHAVAVVTAGRSSTARLRSVGELVRAAGVSVESVVVLDGTEAGEPPEPTADPGTPADEPAAHAREAVP